MTTLHNQVIAFDDIKSVFPYRDAFLDQGEVAKVEHTIKKCEPLLFLPTYLLETSLQDVKYDKAKYKIILMGILPDGSKANVIIDDIEPYFEVKVPHFANQNEQQSYISTLRELLQRDEVTQPIRTSLLKAKTFKYYQPEPSTFIRFYYHKLKNRQVAIKLVRTNNYETTHDDLNNYYRVVCRNTMTTFSAWSIMSNYADIDMSERIKGRTFRVSINNYTPYKGELTQTLLKDKTLSCCWDIETYSSSGELPSPDNKDDCIFCIGLTFQWIAQAEPFLRVCLCDYPADPRPEYLTIVCGNETNIIDAFGQIFARMRPEYIFGFNDADYDWNWLIKRASHTSGLLTKLANAFDSFKPFTPHTDATVFKFNFKKEHVKVDASTYVDGACLMLNGYIPVDVRTVFRQLYPTAEKSSLSWFLSKNKLGSKEDMPYERLFAIYKAYRTLATNNSVIKMKTEFLINDKHDSDGQLRVMYETCMRDLADINKYCVIDAQRCHDLVKIRSVIMDHREVANLSYTSVYDSFYRANGMKVRNLTIAEGQLHPFNIRFSNITNETMEDGKYPGAFVFPPKKGLKISKLSVTERIKKAQLTRNSERAIYQDWLTATDDEINQVYNIIREHKTAVMQPDQVRDLSITQKAKTFLQEEIGRPIAGLDFSSLYPSLIRAYNFSPEYCILDTAQAKAVYATGQRLTKVEFEFSGKNRIGYFVWHNNELNPLNEDGTPNAKFQFGVYGYILNRLFTERSKIKKIFEGYKKKKEAFEAQGAEYIKTHQEEYDDIIFNSNYYNSKQNALKVFMNTFYGEAGNKLSPFFIVEVAGGVTSYGKKNIQLAYAFVREHKCPVYYGDSVAEYTPILVRKNNDTFYCEIKDLAQDTEYHPYNNGKEIAFLYGVDIWSDIGWTKLKHIIRHKTNKKMYRVLTHNSVVDVTEDHSLLTEDGKELKPENAIGQNLLLKAHPIIATEQCQNIAKEIKDYIELLNEHDFEKVTIDITTQRAACLLYALCKHLGLYVSISSISQNAYCVTVTEQEHKECLNVVKSVIELPTTEAYVYDVETENHHFSAGVGEIVVHNTDSIYLSMPETTFADIDVAYYTGQITKLEYWTKMVEISFATIKPLNEAVNNMFLSDNGTKFLSMAYEEFLYPVAFTAKKKYFGIAHEHVANFKPKDLFVRGLEVKKRGVSELLRKIFTDIMWTCMNPDNLYDLLELVLIKIHEIYTTKWNMKDFIQTGIYKPSKNNVKLNTFVERMKTERGIDVKPNERFDYVLVQKYPYKYDFRGRKEALSIGDKIELKEIAEQENMEVDLDYYMQGSINGQLARLITYHDMFNVTTDAMTDDASPDEIKSAEDQIYKHATKYIEDVCKPYYRNYNTFGKAYQKIFRQANKVIGGKVESYDPLASTLLSSNVKMNEFENWFIELCEKKALKDLGNYGVNFVNGELKKAVDNAITIYNDEHKDKSDQERETELKELIKRTRAAKINELQQIYFGAKTSQNIHATRTLAFKQTMSILRQRIKECYNDIAAAYDIYHAGINTLTNLIKKQLGIDQLCKPTDEPMDYTLDHFNVEEVDMETAAESYVDEMFQDEKVINALSKFKTLYLDMISAHTTYHRACLIVEYLKTLRNNTNKVVVRPDTQINDNKDRDIKEMLDANIDF